MKQIRIMEAFVFSFETLKKYPMLLLAPPILISLFMNAIDYFIPTDIALREAFFKNLVEVIVSKYSQLIPILILVFVLLTIAFFIIYISLEIGRIRIVFTIYNHCKEEPSWGFYNNFGKGIISRYFLASILLGLIILGGFILLIVPGFIVAIMYTFVLFILVDQDSSISDAFKRSKELTDGVKWQLFGFMLLTVFVQLTILVPISFLNQLGLNFLYLPINTILSPIVGIFTVVASLYIYKDLLSQAENQDRLIDDTLTPMDQGDDQNLK